MKLFDSHCHLNDPVFGKDFQDTVHRMEKAGVCGLMIVGIDRNNSAEAVKLAETRKGFFASVGIHPHDAKHCSKEDISFLRELAKHPKVRAWGEIGLDFNRMYSPAADQEKCFARQLETADKIGLPLIFHERDSKGRFGEILRTYYNKDRRGVVHCFSGNRREMDNYLDMGFFIGITGIVTVKTRGEELRRLIPHIPKDRILIETDAPYLTPAPERNQHRRNEPAFVRSVLLKIAEVRGEAPEPLSDAVWENTCRLFGIGQDEFR
ncbi:MAG: TatD family hydrolase [Desulfobacterales bacterium]